MKALRDLTQRATQSSPARPGRASRDRRSREELPFFLFLTLVLVLLYGYALNAVPELRAPSRLIPFTLLMLAHGVLHWISPRLEHHPRWVIAYLVLQGALAFALTMLTGEWTIISLYTALIGEAVGLARTGAWPPPLPVSTWRWPS